MRRILGIAAVTFIARVGAYAQVQQASTGAIERRVAALVAQMSLTEKIDLIAGRTGFDIPGLARLGIPTVYAADSPFGVRASGPSTLYAAGVSLAATFNPELARRVGMELGRDARARGRQYSLGPGVNIYRSPLNGRNFEYYGEDPFLASRIAVEFINGMQSQHVSATIKHFMGNNSEFGRNTTDSRIDERTLREIYLPAFEAAVKEAHTGAIMGSYNLTNGFYMTENRHLITDVVKGEWGFDGVYMSDWFAVHNAVAAANAGTDLEMPERQHFNRDSLMPALQQGRISQATIDDKVTRLLRNQARFGWLDGLATDDTTPNYNVAGMQAALQSAREGMVLLKNTGALLPLDKRRLKRIAIIGPNAHPAVTLGGGSATIPTFHAVSVLEGVANALGSGARTTYVRGLPTLGGIAAATNFSTDSAGREAGIRVEVFHDARLSGTPAITRVDKHISVGAPLEMGATIRDDWGVAPQGYAGPGGPVSHRWTGYYHARQPGTFDIVVQQGGFAESGYRLYIDDVLVADRWTFSPAVVETHARPLSAGAHKIVFEHHSENNSFGSPFARVGIVRQGQWVDSAAVAAARHADIVVLAVGFDPQTETENWDRTFALPPGQDELIASVARANSRTIVVANSGGSFDMSRWIDQVPAIIEAWYPGQEGGAALAEVLLGDVNPSGHLPVTFEKRLADNPTSGNYYPDPGTNRIPYREGVFVGYRGFLDRNVAPLFPFGYGLGYTSFHFSNLTVTSDRPGGGAAPRWIVSFNVTNTGKRAGAAVPQVYVSPDRAAVRRPPEELKGFAKVLLGSGQTRRVSVALDMRAFAYFDTTAHQWRADAGGYDIRVGDSSADILLRARVSLPQALTTKP